MRNAFILGAASFHPCAAMSAFARAGACFDFQIFAKGRFVGCLWVASAAAFCSSQLERRFGISQLANRRSTFCRWTSGDSWMSNVP
jgi:hypothetical protein